MESIVLGFCFFIFLFTLYALSRDDFVLLRKNITMDQIFNLSFVSLLVALFAARLFYAFGTWNPHFLNPLMFIAIPYYPGISIMGGVLGFVLFTLYYTSYMKIPQSRVFDFFNCSLLSALTVGYISRLAIMAFNNKTIEIGMYITPILLIILSIICFFILIPKFKRGEMKDAHLGLVFLVIFSASTLLTDILSKTPKLAWVVTLDGILALAVFLFSLVLLLKKERRVIKFAKIRI